MKSTSKPAVASVAAALVFAAACGGSKTPEPTPDPGIAQEAVDVAADTQVLQEAVGAANEVIRNAADCEAAKPAIATARQVFDDVGPRLRTGAARTSLTNLRKQVDRVAELCP